MRTFLILILTGLLFSCTSTERKEAAGDVADSTSTEDTPIAEQPAEDMEPKNIDGLFDDFIYHYMNNASFQLARIAFPLPCVENGKTSTIARKDWTHNELFAKSELYTMLFDAEDMVGTDKDSILQQITVEHINFSNNSAKNYTFQKREGKWMLTGITRHPLSEYAGTDFPPFYKQFVQDGDYRTQHIDNPFEYKTYDADSDSEIEGVLDAAQWSDFAPELPADEWININYCRPDTRTRQRVMVITGQDAGMSCTLLFKKRTKGWILTRLESL